MSTSSQRIMEWLDGAPDAFVRFKAMVKHLTVPAEALAEALENLSLTRPECFEVHYDVHGVSHSTGELFCGRFPSRQTAEAVIRTGGLQDARVELALIVNKGHCRHTTVPLVTQPNGPVSKTHRESPNVNSPSVTVSQIAQIATQTPLRIVPVFTAVRTYKIFSRSELLAKSTEKNVLPVPKTDHIIKQECDESESCSTLPPVSPSPAPLREAAQTGQPPRSKSSSGLADWLQRPNPHSATENKLQKRPRPDATTGADPLPSPKMQPSAAEKKQPREQKPKSKKSASNKPLFSRRASQAAVVPTCDVQALIDREEDCIDSEVVVAEEDTDDDARAIEMRLYDEEHERLAMLAVPNSDADFVLGDGLMQAPSLTPAALSPKKNMSSTGVAKAAKPNALVQHNNSSTAGHQRLAFPTGYTSAAQATMKRFKKTLSETTTEENGEFVTSTVVTYVNLDTGETISEDEYKIQVQNASLVTAQNTEKSVTPQPKKPLPKPAAGVSKGRKAPPPVVVPQSKSIKSFFSGGSKSVAK